MDPLSITMACVALTATVQSCVRFITEFATSCRDARHDLAAISRELSDLDMTLHILKDDTEAKGPDQLPETLRRRICDIMENCNGVLVELKALVTKYEAVGVERAARWALSGRKEAERIHSSLKAHKSALSLVVEATTLHMTMAAATDARKASNDTALLKEYTMKIVEQLARQDEILEQIAWVRAIMLQKSSSDPERTLVMDRYLDNMSDYAGSVCGDSVSDDVADEMQRLALETPVQRENSSSTSIGQPSPFVPGDKPEPMTIVIGNTHRLVTPHLQRSSNKHLWSFYLQASGEEIIQGVFVTLHRTFIPHQLTLKSPPYKVTRIGWGYFVIHATVVLKSGFRWLDRNGRSLKLDWELDLDGLGSSSSREYAVVLDR